MTKQIPLMQVQPGMVTADRVYAPGDTGVPVIRQNTVLTDRMIMRLIELDVPRVPILVEGEPERPKPKPIIDEKLRDEAIGGIRRMFEAAQAGGENMTTAYQIVKELGTVVDQLVDTLLLDPKALVHIADLKSYDEYTYHHSLSVAVLSIAIGQSVGFDPTQLRFLGRIAMMHDIGKTQVPVEIINKPSRLSDTEFTLVKKHSANGYEYLSQSRIGDDAFWHGVLSHHEKIDGSGYPNGLKGNEIPLASRIISIADVYDALTSYRSYRAPMQPAEAVEFIMGNTGKAFDYDIAKAFLTKLEPYPVNTCVELSGGKYAIVIRNANAMRPVVKLLDSDAVLDLSERSSLSVTILRVLDDHSVISR